MSIPEKILTQKFAEICRSRGTKFRVEILDEVDSTNAFAKKIVVPEASIDAVPVAIFAKKQSAGKGRIGRKWASDFEGNIYASFVFFPKIRANEIANFTLWMGVKNCQMLEEKFGVPAKIKRPTDIYLGGKKLSGMLTDVFADAGKIQKIIFGIGINVFAGTANFPEEIAEIATSLSIFKGEKSLPSLDFFAAELTEHVSNSAEKFFAGTFREELKTLWENYDFLRGNEVSAIFGNEKISGIALGIDENGCLKIREKNGEIRCFSAGDAVLAKN